MADYTPPTEDLPIFDSLVFLTGDEPLTYNQAKKKFLRYPNAQGTENLQAINVNGVSNFNAQAIMNDTLTIADGLENSTIFQDNTSNGLIVSNNVLSSYIFLRATDGTGLTKTPVEISSDSVNITGTGLGNIALSTTNTSQNKQIYFTPANAQGAYNPSALDNETTILAKGSAKDNSTMVLSTWSDTYSAVKVSGSNVSIGYGGTNPTTPNNSVVVNANDVIMTSIAGARSLMAYNGGQKAYGFRVQDTITNDILGMYAYANENWDNPIVNLGDKAIVGNGTNNAESLALTVVSSTTSGMRISANDVILGAGGNGNNPSNNIEVNGGADTTYLRGTNLQVVNTNVSFNSAVPPTSSQTIPSPTDSSTKIPTTAWVQSAIASSPSSLPANASFNQLSIVPTSVTTAPMSGFYNIYNEGCNKGFYIPALSTVNVTVDGLSYYVPSRPIQITLTSGDVNPPNLVNPITIEVDCFFWEPITQQMGRDYFRCIIFPSVTSPSTPPSTGYGFQFPTSPSGYNGLYDIYNTINGNNSFFYTDPTYAPNGRQYWFYDTSYHDFGSGRKAGWVGCYPNGTNLEYIFAITLTAFNANPHYYLYNTRVNNYDRGSGSFNTAVKIFP